nr:single-pass membrane and coiled-coil domain-containing protein 1 isoform X2 [Equus asinus]
MNNETTTLISLKEAMKRVDHKLQALEAQFKELDFTKDNLTQKFEHHSKTLASQAAQDELWTAVLALRFTSMELNILYSYVIEVLICLHTRVLEKLPDLVSRFSPVTILATLRRFHSLLEQQAQGKVRRHPNGKQAGLRHGDRALPGAGGGAHSRRKSHPPHFWRFYGWEGLFWRAVVTSIEVVGSLRHRCCA